MSKRRFFALILIMIALMVLVANALFTLLLWIDYDAKEPVMCKDKNQVPVVQVFNNIPWLLIENKGRACPSYLYPSLLIAAKKNKCVILIGEWWCESMVNEVRKQLKPGHEIHFHDIKTSMYMKTIENLKAIFPHHWFSIKMRYYEFLCFARFYILQSFMNKFDIKHAMYQDSDTLLLVNATDIVNKITHKSEIVNTTYMKPLDVALVIDRSGFSSAHFSIFSREGLADALNFFNHFFMNHNMTNVKGFSDMTAFNLYVFSSIPKEERWCKEFLGYEFRCGEHERFVIPPLTYKRSREVLSLNAPALRISSDVEGIFDLNLAGDVHWHNSVPYVKDSKTQYFGLHFQGNKKSYMHDYLLPYLCSTEPHCACEGLSCYNCLKCNMDRIHNKAA